MTLPKKSDQGAPSGGDVVVGRVKDAHGLKGELFIVLFAGEAAWLKSLKTLRLVPADKSGAREFTVRSARLHKNGLIVTTQEIRDRTAAESLRGAEFSVPESFFVAESGEEPYLREVLGFTVIRVTDGAREAVGVVDGFSSNGAQDLALVRLAEGVTRPVPFVAPLVHRVDYAAKTIEMTIPVGLLEDDDDVASALNRRSDAK